MVNSHAVVRIKFVEFAKVTFATGHEARELAVAIHAIPVAIVRMELMNLIILKLESPSHLTRYDCFY